MWGDINNSSIYTINGTRDCTVYVEILYITLSATEIFSKFILFING
ncbi:hypothetical protein [Salmonella phage Tennessee]